MSALYDPALTLPGVKVTSVDPTAAFSSFPPQISATSCNPVRCWALESHNGLITNKYNSEEYTQSESNPVLAIYYSYEANGGSRENYRSLHKHSPEARFFPASSYFVDTYWLV